MTKSVAALFATLAVTATALAEPVPKITPFEGLWVGKGELATCKDARESGGGDHLIIEGHAIGAGDTACTLIDMTVQGKVYYFKMHCHGINRSMAGTKHIRIDDLGPGRILFRHQGEQGGEMERCPKGR